MISKDTKEIAKGVGMMAIILVIFAGVAFTFAVVVALLLTGCAHSPPPSYPANSYNCSALENTRRELEIAPKVGVALANPDPITALHLLEALQDEYGIGPVTCAVDAHDRTLSDREYSQQEPKIRQILLNAEAYLSGAPPCHW